MNHTKTPWKTNYCPRIKIVPVYDHYVANEIVKEVDEYTQNLIAECGKRYAVGSYVKLIELPQEMADTIWVCESCHTEYEGQNGSPHKIYRTEDYICSGTIKQYIPQSLLTSTQSKLSLAVDALKEIRSELAWARDYVIDHLPDKAADCYNEADNAAKKCLEALETEVKE